MLRTFAIALTFATALSSAHAAQITCEGEISTGTDTSELGQCAFGSQTPSASQIFKTCKEGDQCRIVADANKMNGFDSYAVRRVISVKLLKAGPNH